MANPQGPFKIAAVQAAPVFLNREATLEKAGALIREAGSAGGRLIVFPESFIPAYPEWVWVVPSGRDRILSQLYGELLENAVTIPSPATERIGQAEVKFVPYQSSPEDVAKYYQIADVYVHAARADTFPNTVLEALACGAPVVATAVGGIPEQIKGLRMADAVTAAARCSMGASPGCA